MIIRPMHKHNGFTLIEVLVALVILAISLTALMLTNGQLVRNAAYIQDKTAAHWLAMNIVSQVEMGLLRPGVESAEITGTSELLNQQWHWQAALKNTADVNTLRIHVEVRNDHQVNSTLDSYLEGPPPWP